jgi:hypothetical protein
MKKLSNKIIEQMLEDFMEDDEQQVDGEETGDEEELSENGDDNIDRKLSGKARGVSARNDITRSQIGRVLANNASRKMAVVPKGEEEIDDNSEFEKVHGVVKRNKINQHAKGIEDMLAGKEMFVNGKKYDNTKMMRESYVKQLRMVLENEIEQAGVLMAAKGFSQDIQSMVEKMGRLMNEDLGPVVDNMRMAYGAQQAESFGQAMRTDMQSIMDNLLTVKDNIDDAVDELAAGQVPNMSNDMDSEMTDDSGIDGGLGDIADEIGDDFGGDESASGPIDDPLGRPQKESIENLKAQLVEMKAKIDKFKSKKK